MNSKEKLLLKTINERSHKNIIVNKIIPPCVGIKRTKFMVSCLIHGDCNEFKNIWQPTGDTLINGKLGCPKCSKHYNETETEALININKKTSNTINIDRFIGEYIGVKSICKITCKVHGNCNEFEKKWNTMLKELKRKKLIECPKCKKEKTNSNKTLKVLKKKSKTIKNKNISKTKKNIVKLSNLNRDDLVNELNNNTYNGLRIDSICNDFNINKLQTKCIVICEIHGKSNEWGNKWTPTIDSLQKGTRCIKCVKLYKRTDDEMIQHLNEITEKKINIEKIYNESEKKTDKRKCLATCLIHGRGIDWDTKWTPTIRKLREGSSCPKCGFESRMLSTLLKNTKLMDESRDLYFAKFISKNDKEFYKVGVCRNGIKTRYSNTLIRRDNLKLCNYEIIKLNSLVALLTEYWILKKFKKYRVDMYHRMKNSHGGGECFSKNIMNNLTLEDSVLFALENLNNGRF